jgi:hypothetical protein
MNDYHAIENEGWNTTELISEACFNEIAEEYGDWLWRNDYIGFRPGYAKNFCHNGLEQGYNLAGEECTSVSWAGLSDDYEAYSRAIDYGMAA